jgi:anti-sigma regulatory factor (Ser/Thr protein kinase)
MIGYFYLRFGADFRPESVDRVKVQVSLCLERCGIRGSGAFLLLNLMNELICDILEHGRGSWLELEIHPEEGRLRLIFRDNGTPFDPEDSLKRQNLDDWVDTEDRRKLSFYMVSRIAHAWSYRWVEGTMNELCVDVTVA